MSSFDPHSTDSMFSTILAELKELKTQSDRIETQTTKTNGRVSKLETWQTDVRARVAVYAALSAGGVTFLILLVEHFWNK